MRGHDQHWRPKALLVALVALVQLLGCGAPPARSPDGEPPELILAQEGAPPGEDEPTEKPPTDFVDFPTVDGLLPRDFVMEETTGKLKGYLTRFYRVREEP